MATNEIKAEALDETGIQDKRIRISFDQEDEQIVRVFLHDYFAKFIHEKRTGEFIGILLPNTDYYNLLKRINKDKEKLQELGVWIEVEELVTSSFFLSSA